MTVTHLEDVSSEDVLDAVHKGLLAAKIARNELDVTRVSLYTKPVVLQTHCPIPGAGEPDSLEFDESLVEVQLVDDSHALTYRGIEIYWCLRDDGNHYEYWFALYSGSSDNGDEFDLRDLDQSKPDKYAHVPEWVTFRHGSLSDEELSTLCYGVDADQIGSDEVPTHFENVTKCRKARRHNKVKDKDGYCAYCLTES